MASLGLGEEVGYGTQAGRGRESPEHRRLPRSKGSEVAPSSGAERRLWRDAHFRCSRHSVYSTRQSSASTRFEISLVHIDGPHSALGWQMPEAYANGWRREQSEAGSQDAVARQSRPVTVLADVPLAAPSPVAPLTVCWEGRLFCHSPPCLRFDLSCSGQNPST